MEKIGTRTLRNGYGPTETTIGASYTGIVTPRKLEIEFSGTVTDQRKHHCGLRKSLKIYNVYGPAEAYIASTEVEIIER